MILHAALISVVTYFSKSSMRCHGTDLLATFAVRDLEVVSRESICWLHAGCMVLEKSSLPCGNCRWVSLTMVLWQLPGGQ